MRKTKQGVCSRLALRTHHLRAEMAELEENKTLEQLKRAAQGKELGLKKAQKQRWRRRSFGPSHRKRGRRVFNCGHLAMKAPCCGDLLDFLREDSKKQEIASREARERGRKRAGCSRSFRAIPQSV
ncbi:hypothetical protein WMY93_031754 [Mugilogobius chulae]|uniref:Uncharacterized protein n=1 Tax=Mugilogobius chulae TaxID=88201 RepID=A0AAW0MCX6_9GOBI